MASTLAETLLKRLNAAKIITETKHEAQPAIPSAVRGEAPQAKLVPSLEEIQKQSLEIGIQNRAFYLNAAEKTGQPWHYNVKFPYQYSEFVVITPQMGQILIDHMPFNRKISTSSLDAISRDLTAGRWIQTAESLGIDVEGNFYDGNHRVLSVVREGIEQNFYVTFNAPVEAKFVTDSGRKRSTAEKLRYVLGTDHIDTKLAAVARSMMRGNNNSKIKFTDSEIAVFALKYKDIISWATQVMPKKRADIQAAVAKAAMLHGKERIIPFCDRYHNMLFAGPTDPAKALYSYFDKHGNLEQLTVYRRTLAALEHELANRPVRHLHERDRDIFEFDAEWDIKQ